VSPDDRFLAFGTHKSIWYVEVLKINKKHKKLTFFAKIQMGISSACLHIDWDTDSQHIVVNSQAYELKFANILSK